VIVIVLGLLSKESYEITSSHPQVRGEPLPQPREGGANWRLCSGSQMRKRKKLNYFETVTVITVATF
jgi:hypothetical protein